MADLQSLMEEYNRIKNLLNEEIGKYNTIMYVKKQAFENANLEPNHYTPQEDRAYIAEAFRQNFNDRIKDYDRQLNIHSQSIDNLEKRLKALAENLKNANRQTQQKENFNKVDGQRQEQAKLAEVERQRQEQARLAEAERQKGHVQNELSML
jgi:regulator of protease activity HflC (stomatin/prohibitin superfamily)